MILTDMNLTEWNALSQVIYNLAGSVAALGTLGAAIYAVIVYRRNSRLERARWASSLYEKFYEREQLKEVRELLDCESNQERVDELVLKGKADFTDYLNFFEYVAFLKHSKQLEVEEIEDLFGYYLACLNRHNIVLKYIKENGYERLHHLLESLK